MKKLLKGVMISLLSLMLFGCQSAPVENKGNKQVVVSFEAIRLVTEELGGEYIDVTTLVPQGQEPHDYQPTVKDMEQLENCDLFIVNGFGMESWMDSVMDSTSVTKMIQLSDGIEPIELTEEEEIEEHGQYDPHIWLSLTNVEKEAELIKDTLIEIDPKHESEFEANYKRFVDNLKGLYDEYAAKFAELENKKYVTGHAAFGYLCRDFGLEQNSVEDVYGAGEPTAKQLSELVEYCRANNIKTIFSESAASPKVSETLAAEVEAEVVEIDTLEEYSEKGYLERMQDNLEKIYTSLK